MNLVTWRYWNSLHSSRDLTHLSYTLMSQRLKIQTRYTPSSLLRINKPSRLIALVAASVLHRLYLTCMLIHVNCHETSSSSYSDSAVEQVLERSRACSVTFIDLSIFMRWNLDMFYIARVTVWTICYLEVNVIYCWKPPFVQLNVNKGLKTTDGFHTWPFALLISRRSLNQYTHVLPFRYIFIP